MNRFKRIIFIFNALALSSTLLAQMTVSGTVSDAVTGRPLSQVNVIVEGTNKGSATDNNGNFTIGNVSNGSTINVASLFFWFPGINSILDGFISSCQFFCITGFTSRFGSWERSFRRDGVWADGSHYAGSALHHEWW